MKRTAPNRADSNRWKRQRASPVQTTSGASLASLSRNELDLVVRHLNTRNLARFATVQRGVGAVAANALRKRPAKVPLDALYPSIQAMQEFSRAVAAKVAAAPPGMSLNRFARIIKEQVYAPYRGSFQLNIEREDYYPFLSFYLSAEFRDPSSGPGFLRITFDYDVKRVDRRLIFPSYTNYHYWDGVATLRVETPYLDCTTGFYEIANIDFRTARPLKSSATIYIDRQNRVSIKAEHLIIKYAILGETKWCQARMTEDQALNRIQELRGDKESKFIQPNVILEVIAALFNDTIAKTMKRALVKEMNDVQRDGCRLIRSRKAHTGFDSGFDRYGIPRDGYPLLRRLLLARELTGRRPVLSDRNITSFVESDEYRRRIMPLNGLRIRSSMTVFLAEIIKQRRDAMQRRSKSKTGTGTRRR